jgi:MacB-like periplasmic core domain
MTLGSRFRSWLRTTFGRSRMESEMDTELRFHIETFTEDLVRGGLSRQAAVRRARMEFGGMERTKEECREARGLTLLEHLTQDVRFALRMLRKSPGFAIAAILTLALGIGANTAIFSFIDGILLRSLPVKDPQQLVVLRWSAHTSPKLKGHSDYGDCRNLPGDCSFSLPFFKNLRDHINAFSGMAAFAGPLDCDFSGNGPASMAQGQYVSGDFFLTLGVNAIIGRPLAVTDDSPSAPPAIVLSYAYWQHAFGAERSVVGRMVRLNNISTVIVGVAEPRFTNLTPGKNIDFFMPFSVADRIRPEHWGHGDRISDPSVWWSVIVGRLKPAVSLAQAQAVATTMFVNETTHGATPFLSEADSIWPRPRPAWRAHRFDAFLEANSFIASRQCHAQWAPVPFRKCAGCCTSSALHCRADRRGVARPHSTQSSQFESRLRHAKYSALGS